MVGLVIISTFTATITTVLTATSLANEAKLYGTKVGALSNSEEFRLGVKRNADVRGWFRDIRVSVIHIPYGTNFERAKGRFVAFIGQIIIQFSF